MLFRSLSTSAYQGQENPNSIEFQIDTGEMLGKIEHFLRGEYIKLDEENNEFWAKPTKILLNKEGKVIQDENKKIGRASCRERV